MDKSSIEVFKENLLALNLSKKRLKYSYDICIKTGLKDNFSEEEFISFEAMTSRYARTTDILINKVLRSLDVLEFMDSGSIIDTVNNTEKRGITEANILRNLKDLRNSISHEYETENIVRFFEKVLEFTPILFSIIDKLNKYCELHINYI